MASAHICQTDMKVLSAQLRTPSSSYPHLTHVSVIPDLVRKVLEAGQTEREAGFTGKHPQKPERHVLTQT